MRDTSSNHRRRVIDIEAIVISPAKRERLLRNILIYALAVSFGLLSIFPFYWMFATSVKLPAEVYSTPPTLIPESFSFSNYINVLTNAAFMRFFTNSMLVASLTVVAVMILAIPAGYSLGRLKYKGRIVFSRYIFVFYLFPGVLLLVPLYLLISKLGLQDSPLGLILIYTTFQAPYATILIRQYLSQIPLELEDAARVDGASQWRVIWSVVIPLARPGIAVAAITTFIGSWSEFIMASMLTVSESTKTLPVGLYEWMGTYDIEWGRLTAGAVITAVPILILFAFIGRIFIRGLLGGAMKG